ncbi:hypothetical protein PG993_006547 [Apiospora rasikravindrae]|uniref:C2H2-type domain-containing protein n=1 Tax=Apiospora rasikravindrae TaxID=990691 RepID=A0ABR1T617_9PEZI
MNDPIDSLDPYYGLDPLSSDLKSRFDYPGTTTNDDMFVAGEFSLDLNSFGSTDFGYGTNHPHDDGCTIRCPEDSNASSQYRGAPAHMSSYAKARAASISFPPYSYGTDSHLYPGNGQLGFDQMMGLGWASQDPKQESDDGLKFFPGYGTECSAAGCPDTYCPSSCTIPQCTGANQECSTEDQCSSISCLEGDHSTPPCDIEDCVDPGSPCNDPHCMDLIDQTTSLDTMWDHHEQWREFGYTPPDQFLTHGQQCNHTNTEHSVALTLGHLRDPGPQDQPQDPNLVQFGCPIFDQGGSLEKLCGMTQQITSTSEPPPLCPDTANDSPGTLTDSTSSKSGKQGPTENRCEWLMRDGDQFINCNRVFNTCEELNNHVCDDHVNLLVGKERYFCLWHECKRNKDANFNSKNKLRRHIATHTKYKPFECDVCGEGFSARQALEQHERCHSGAKPYVCTVPGCDKAFKQKSALTMHKRTHTGEKPLVCGICGKAFGESSNLSKHRKIHNTGNKLKCPEPNCDKEFIRADQLRRHQETHEKKREARQTRQKKIKARTKSAMIQGDVLKAATMISEQYQFPLPINGGPPSA